VGTATTLLRLDRFVILTDLSGVLLSHLHGDDFDRIGRCHAVRIPTLASVSTGVARVWAAFLDPGNG
jgi:hypothetical protein